MSKFCVDVYKKGNLNLLHSLRFKTEISRLSYISREISINTVVVFKDF